MTPPRPDLFVRSTDNPVLTVEALPYPANAIFNPAAARLDGETVVLARVEDLRGISRLHVARSSDGRTGWRLDDEALLAPDPDVHPEEIWGCEDPRVMWLPELEEWAITYTAYSRRGPLVSLAFTRDFRSIRRHGPIMPPDDKDAALFPRRFGGMWAMLHRPSPIRGSAHIWVSYSPDLRHWGDHTMVLEAREGAWWDAEKIGLGPPPLETSEGWLLLYHGVKRTSSGRIYRLGLALLDLEDPTVALHRSEEWVFGPREPYECHGDVANVVFPCGWVHDQERGEVVVYYGGADSCVAVATARFDDLMTYVLACPPPLHRRAEDRLAEE